MQLNEPSPAQGEIHFSLLHIPVRVHPMFWVMGLILGASGFQERGLRTVLVWLVAIFVSVLVHEMGHALVIRALGVQPWITLYGMGGLTSHQGGQFRPAIQILVSLAGPVAGFALAALVVALIKVSGRDVHFIFGWPYLIGWHLEGLANPTLFELCGYLLFANIWWGILNLLPILPLDGGQVTNEVLNICYPRRALQISLWVSVVVAMAMAVSGMTRRPVDFFRIVLFGSLAYSSFQMLSAYSGSRRG